jgi:predicted ribosomally synthesized peptide with nif11-like leader
VINRAFEWGSSVDDVIRAIEEASAADAAFAKALAAAADIDELVAVARASGFEVSAAEMRVWVSKISELSDEELAGISGGVMSDAEFISIGRTGRSGGEAIWNAYQG